MPKIMIDATIAKVKGFLLNPVETFQQTKGDDPKTVFIYFAVLLFIFSLLSAIVTATGMDSMFGSAFPITGDPISGGIFLLFISSFIGVFISTLILAVWLHLWVYIFGGRNGIMQTLKALLYGSTPGLLFGWIPFIGILFSIWSLVLGILGIRELQDLSTARAVVITLIAVVIPIVVLVLLFVLVLSFFVVGDVFVTETLY